MEIDQLNFKSAADEIFGQLLKGVSAKGDAEEATNFLQQLLGEIETLKEQTGGDSTIERQLTDLTGEFLPQEEKDFLFETGMLEGMGKKSLAEKNVDDLPSMTSPIAKMPLEEIARVIHQLPNVSESADPASLAATSNTAAAAVESFHLDTDSDKDISELDTGIVKDISKNVVTDISTEITQIVAKDADAAVDAVANEEAGFVPVVSMDVKQATIADPLPEQEAGLLQMSNGTVKMNNGLIEDIETDPTEAVDGIEEDISSTRTEETWIIGKTRGAAPEATVVNAVRKMAGGNESETNIQRNLQSGSVEDGEIQLNTRMEINDTSLNEKIVGIGAEASVTAKGGPQVVAVPVPGLANNTAAAGRPIQTSVESPLGQPGWDQEFGEQVVWMTRNGLQTAELRLNPRHLGPVEVRIHLNQDQAGIVFSSQHSVVREAIESALPRLREIFVAQQIDLGDVHVSQQSFAEQRESQERRSNTPYPGGFSGEAYADGADERQDEEPRTESKIRRGVVSYYV